MFTATVTNTSNTEVTWTVTEAGGGTVTNGIYTAPAGRRHLPRCGEERGRPDEDGPGDHHRWAREDRVDGCRAGKRHGTDERDTGLCGDRDDDLRDLCRAIGPLQGRPVRPAPRVRERGGFGESRLFMAVRDACERAGVTPFGPGQYRHTVANRMINAGADPAGVAAFLGHKSPQTTRRFYATLASVPRPVGVE